MKKLLLILVGILGAFAWWSQKMSKSIFQKTFDVRWADLDSNIHMRHSAYADYCAHLRFKWMQEMGLGLDELTANNIGPVIFKETLCYLKEIRPNESFTVDLLMGEIPGDKRKWKISHNIFNSKSEKAATVEVDGAWMDVKIRKLTVLPDFLEKKVEFFLTKQGNQI